MRGWQPTDVTRPEYEVGKPQTVEDQEIPELLQKYWAKISKHERQFRNYLQKWLFHFTRFMYSYIRMLLSNHSGENIPPKRTVYLSDFLSSVSIQSIYFVAVSVERLLLCELMPRIGIFQIFPMQWPAFWGRNAGKLCRSKWIRQQWFFNDGGRGNLDLDLTCSRIEAGISLCSPALIREVSWKSVNWAKSFLFVTKKGEICLLDLQNGVKNTTQLNWQFFSQLNSNSIWKKNISITFCLKFLCIDRLLLPAAEKLLALPFSVLISQRQDVPEISPTVGVRQQIFNLVVLE